MGSVHKVADLDMDKDQQLRKRHGRGPRDLGAGWGVKDGWPGKIARVVRIPVMSNA